MSYLIVRGLSSVPRPAQTGLLLFLGLASLAIFSPQWSMAELMVDDPPVGALFGQALPLMGMFTVIGAIALWAAFSRRVSTLPSVLTTVAVLALLLGHNATITGLVDIPARRRVLPGRRDARADHRSGCFIHRDRLTAAGILTPLKVAIG
ncbi:MAG: hypothetical protein U9R51_00530 [Actinomycetota bacterium]|nr:hypothetical protein [Actinomycetota bacterium]